MIQTLFNLSPLESSQEHSNYIHCLVIYDIRSNKRRLKLSNILSGHGTRIQKSCFECHLSRKEFSQLELEIEQFYKSEAVDNIIIYRIDTQTIRRFNDFDFCIEINDFVLI